jgi:glycosyltransferase involved in cell wall biosynthesis
LVGDDSIDEQTATLLSKGTSDWPEVKYAHNKPRLGQAANICRLMSKASGNFALILHDDDFLLPEALYNLALTFEKFPGADVAYGKQLVVDDDDVEVPGVSERLNSCYARNGRAINESLDPMIAALVQQIPNDGFLVRTQKLKEVRPEKILAAGDACDFYVGYGLAGVSSRFVFLNRFISAYRVTASSVSRGGQDLKGGFSNAAYHMMRIVTTEVPKNISENSLVTRALARTIRPAIVQAARLNDLPQAWKWFLSPLHFRSFPTLGWFYRLIFLIGHSIARGRNRMRATRNWSK